MLRRDLLVRRSFSGGGGRGSWVLGVSLVAVMTTTGSAQYTKPKTSVAHRGASAYAPEHTLAEVKRLDAGSWFNAKFKGEKVPTFDEAIALIRGKAGVFPELKVPELYAGRKINFEKLVADALDRNGLRGPKADPKTPVILQTFSQQTARNLAQMKIGVPVVLLMEFGQRLESHEQVRAWKGIVQGFGPTKRIVLSNPDFVKWAHAEGMSVTPYTFRASDALKSGFKDVNEEMAHYLYKLDVDALFTDNPDQFPRR